MRAKEKMRAKVIIPFINTKINFKVSISSYTFISIFIEMNVLYNISTVNMPFMSKYTYIKGDQNVQW